jgi:uncharacterized membrane protein YhaH (DUF805 family)
MGNWQILNPEGRLKRRPFLLRFIILSLFAVFGGYVIRSLLGTENDISPYYLEITFLWKIVILAVFTPFAIQRCRDIGISIWWVLLLWISPLSNLKFSLIVSKYTGFTISGITLWVLTFIALLAMIFIVMLFFSRSDNLVNHPGMP